MSKRKEAESEGLRPNFFCPDGGYEQQAGECLPDYTSVMVGGVRCCIPKFGSPTKRTRGEAMGRMEQGWAREIHPKKLGRDLLNCDADVIFLDLCNTVATGPPTDKLYDNTLKGTLEKLHKKGKKIVWLTARPCNDQTLEGTLKLINEITPGRKMRQSVCMRTEHDMCVCKSSSVPLIMVNGRSKGKRAVECLRWLGGKMMSKKFMDQPMRQLKVAFYDDDEGYLADFKKHVARKVPNARIELVKMKLL